MPDEGYLRIEGIKGGSTNPMFPGWIPFWSRSDVQKGGVSVQISPTEGALAALCEKAMRGYRVRGEVVSPARLLGWVIVLQFEDADVGVFYGREGQQVTVSITARKYRKP